MPGTAVAVRTKQRFWVDVPFTTKAATGGAAKAGDLVLSGYASTWVEDRDGEYVDPTAFDSSLALYLAKNPMLLWQHNHDWPLGQVSKAVVDEHGLDVEAWVRKPQQGEEPYKFSAYYDIKAGIVKTFSIGGMFTRDIRAGKPVITDVELWEISCVSIPSNPDSIYQAAVKAIKGEHRPGLHQKAIDQMAQVLGLAVVSDPELARMDSAALQERYHMLAALYKRAGKHAPAFGAWRTIAARVMENDANAGSNVLVDARDVVGVTKAVYGMVPSEDVKKGRTISKANEQRLTQAKEHIDSVLASIAAQPDEMEEYTGMPPAVQLAATDGAAKAAGDTVWTEESGFSDLQGDIAALLNGPDEWRWWVQDINLDHTRALLCDSDENVYYVAALTVADDGTPELAPQDEWVVAEQEWVEASEASVARARARGNGA